MNTIDQYMPVDAEAERSVLAAILTSPEAFLDVVGELDADDFGIASHQAVYRAALGVDAAGQPIDQITIVDQLRRNKELTRAGGPDGVADLFAYGAQTANVPAHVRIVADKSKLRRLLVAGRAIATDALDPRMDADTALERAETKVFELGKSAGQATLVTMDKAVPKALLDLAKARTSVLVGTSTGIDSLDRMTGGLTGGQLIVVAARPAMGKSAFATGVAQSIAASTGLPVPLLSYEMSTTEITMRLLAAELKYDLHKLRNGDIPSGMEQDLSAAAKRLASSTLMIDDNPPETISGVRSAMRRLAARSPLGAIVVDYLQLMSGEGKSRDENRQQEISDISRGLKRLATELDVPVIALSQLNRALEQRPNKRPQLSDLRDSGAIEQDASAVIFLYRDCVYNAAANPEDGELILAKQRNGPIGILPLRFNPAATTWSEGGLASSGSNAGGLSRRSGSYQPGYSGGSANPF